MRKNGKFQYVKDLIRNLAIDDRTSETPRMNFFWHEGEGGLHLNRRQIDQYVDVKKELIKHFGKAEDISPSTIESFMQRAILYALDISRKRQEKNFEERIEIAVSELIEKLGQKPKKYQCYLPVRGIESQSLPFRFGLVNFQMFSEPEMGKLHRELRHHVVSKEQLEIREEALNNIRTSSTWKTPCATVEVTAKDQEAALAKARREVRLTLDLLNFFTDLSPYNYGWLYFPEEAAPVTVLSIVLGEDHSFSLPHRREGPPIDFSFRRLKNAKHIQPLIRRMNRLLRNPNQKQINHLLISSVQWAGRATIEQRKEEAFLLYAIALESIILPGSGPWELRYRLGIRTAQLIGGSIEERSKMTKEVENLYTLRSKIVHNGFHQITDDQLDRMRRVVKYAICAVITNGTINRLETPSDLEGWFERKVLI